MDDRVKDQIGQFTTETRKKVAVHSVKHLESNPNDRVFCMVKPLNGLRCVIDERGFYGWKAHDDSLGGKD
jgi:hypothetical protein